VRKLKESKASASGGVNLLSEEIDFSVVRSRMIVIVDFVNSQRSLLGRLDKLHSTQGKSDFNGALRTLSSDHIRGP